MTKQAATITPYKNIKRWTSVGLKKIGHVCVLTLFLLMIATLFSGCSKEIADQLPAAPETSKQESVSQSPVPGEQPVKTQLPASEPDETEKILVQVTRVVDGDTIEVNFNGEAERVRLIGIDTPETVHPNRGEEPYGREASNFTKTWLEGKQVGLEFDVQERDRYGRLLAYAWLNNQLFNEILVREGYAKVSTYPPNVKYVDLFTAAQKEAREANRGLWGIVQESTPQPPAELHQGNYTGSKQSDKYHLPNCQWSEKIKKENLVTFQSKEEARSMGYLPCGVCKP